MLRIIPHHAVLGVIYEPGIFTVGIRHSFIEGVDMDSGNYLLGRQPILNRNEELVAYELLFRSAGSLAADVTNASHATASVIINTLTGFGIEDILGKHKGFINMELELLMDDSLYILPLSLIHI